MSRGGGAGVSRHRQRLMSMPLLAQHVYEQSPDDVLAAAEHECPAAATRRTDDKQITTDPCSAPPSIAWPRRRVCGQLASGSSRQRQHCSDDRHTEHRSDHHPDNTAARHRLPHRPHTAGFLLLSRADTSDSSAHSASARAPKTVKSRIARPGLNFEAAFMGREDDEVELKRMLCGDWPLLL